MNLPTTFNDLIEEANSLQLYKKLIKQLNKDFLFANIDLDFEEETIIRREILPSGKSRAFINDTPTTVQTLQLLSEKLIDVHSQHQTVQLADGDFQFYIIDALANNSEKIASYKRGLLIFNKLTKELKTLKKEQEALKDSFSFYKLYNLT